MRKILGEPLSPPPTPRQAKARKIDPYVPYLEKRLEAGVFNASKLYQEILQQGYSGKERQVRAFVQPARAARQAQWRPRCGSRPNPASKARSTGATSG